MSLFDPGKSRGRRCGRTERAFAALFLSPFVLSAVALGQSQAVPERDSSAKAKAEPVGEARDGKSLLELAEQLQPDVLVIDISMPALSGIEAAQQLKKKGTKAIIVFLTVHDDPDFVRAALATGASGYVTKSRMATDLLPAIEETLAGRRFISPSLWA